MGDNFHPQDNQMPGDEGSGVPPGVQVGVDNPVVVDDATAAAATQPNDETATAAALVNAHQLPPQPVDAPDVGVLDAPPVDAAPHEDQQQQHQVELQQVPVQVQQYHVDAAEHVNVDPNAAHAAHTHAVATGTATTVEGETLHHIDIPMPKVDDGTGAASAADDDDAAAAANGVTIVHHTPHGDHVNVTQDPHHDGTTADPTAAMDAMPALTIPHTPHTLTHAPPHSTPHAMHQITAATAGLSAAASSLIATPSKPSTKQERMDAIWMKHYKELQEYKVQHGHVRVPRKSGPLGEWVRTQRRYYKLWRRGESVPLTKERMELLDHLGFVWLPAEEKVGGGFRGGRPKKRKREEEDALAAANAAAAAAAVAAGGHTNPAFFHHLASPAALNVAANSALPCMETPVAAGPPTDAMTPHDTAATPGVDHSDVGGVVDVHAGAPGTTATTTAEDPIAVHNMDGTVGQLVEGTNPADTAAAAAAMTNIPGGVGVGSVGMAMSGVPVSMPVYTYHHDPFHFQSMSKRSDIANQINTLNNRQSLNRQTNQGGPKIEYATEGLANAHSHYEDVVYVLKRSNEELRDAELALDRAKKTYDQAQALKDKADALLSNASDEVLAAELEDGNDEWIAMYKCLVKYKEANGNILFPRLSTSDKSNGNSGGDGTPGQPAASAESSGNETSYGTVGVNEDGEVIGVAHVTKAQETDPVEVSEADAQKLSGGTPVAPDNSETTAPTTTATTEPTTEGGETKADEPMKEGEDTAVSVAAAVAAASAVPMEGVATEEGKKDEPQSMDVDTPNAEGTAATGEKAAEGAASTAEVNDEVNGEAKEGETAAPQAGGDTQMEPPPGTTFVHAPPNTIEVTDAILHDWVAKMRKFPKKQFKKWRRHALDKLGFVWHQYNATWTDRYRELVEFRNQHGHTVVPTSNSNLGIWVGTQRKQYRLMQQGKSSHMTTERVDMLNQIDFVWHVNTWNERYEELKSFKDQFGHFLVPTDYQNKQLRPWITTQRSHYRFLQEGKPSQLTEERIEMLDKIGFPWKTREDWQTRYQELVQYIEENGNCAVPRNYNRFPKLYRWVNCQRMEYQKYTEGSSSRLKADQISLLENVGFE